MVRLARPMAIDVVDERGRAILEDLVRLGVVTPDFMQEMSVRLGLVQLGHEWRYGEAVKEMAQFMVARGQETLAVGKDLEWKIVQRLVNPAAVLLVEIAASRMVRTVVNGSLERAGDADSGHGRSSEYLSLRAVAEAEQTDPGGSLVRALEMIRQGKAAVRRIKRRKAIAAQGKKPRVVRIG